MPTRTALQRALVGPSGEHFVLFRLYQQGILASLSPPGSPTVDVLVLAPDETVIATVQVKTRTYGTDKGWHMGVKHESFAQPRCFYAFVDLEVSKDHLPVTYIVPSSVVASFVKASHKAWLGMPGIKGQPHRDNPIRRVKPASPYTIPGFPNGWIEQYKEKWDSLRAAVE